MNQFNINHSGDSGSVLQSAFSTSASLWASITPSTTEPALNPSSELISENSLSPVKVTKNNGIRTQFLNEDPVTFTGESKGKNREGPLVITR